jgi:hypothetical protein
MPARDRLFELHRTDRGPALSFAESDGMVWIGSAGPGEELERVSGPDRAAFGVRVVRHRLAAYLAVLPLRPPALVNGLPMSGLAVLSSGDSLVVVPGCLCHVTERFRPHVGSPPEELVGKKCPFCSLAITAQTRIGVCRCGAPYHHETAESHPEIAEEDRLCCFTRARACLACSRELTSEEYRLWDPGSL